MVDGSLTAAICENDCTNIRSPFGPQRQLFAFMANFFCNSSASNHEQPHSHQAGETNSHLYGHGQQGYAPKEDGPEVCYTVKCRYASHNKGVWETFGLIQCGVPFSPHNALELFGK